MSDKHEDLKTELDYLFAGCDSVDEICEQQEFIKSIVDDWANEKIREMRGPKPAAKSIEEIDDGELDYALKSFENVGDPTDLEACFSDIIRKEKERRLENKNEGKR